jgi:hypothetical protein
MRVEDNLDSSSELQTLHAMARPMVYDIWCRWILLIFLIIFSGSGVLGQESNSIAKVLSQILLEFECGHRPDIIMLRAPQTAEMQ